MDYKNVCRTCLVTNTGMISLFNKADVSGTVKYVEMLQECTSIQISQTDSLPKILCIKCTEQLESSYQFKKKCMNSEQKLIEILKPETKLDLEKHPLKTVDDSTSDMENTQFENFLLLNDVHVKVEIDPLLSVPPEDSAMSKTKFKCKPKKKIVSHRLKRNLVSGNNFQCSECGEHFSMKTEYTQHVRRVHSLNQYKCDICQKVYIAYWAFVNHKLTHGYNCTTCFKNFDKKSDLEQHAIEHSGQTGFVCKECGKEFIRKRRLILHMRTHTGERPHLCTVCGKAFALQGNLNTHMRIHNGRKPYTCQLCNSSFAQWNSLRSHLITHSNEKNYICPTCGKRLSRQSALKRHIMSHTDVRNYPCQICGKRFKASSERNKHKIIHTGEKNHKCTFCGKSFNRADNLRIHNKIHTGERPHVCSICGRGFIQLHVLNTHQKTHQKPIIQYSA